MAVTQGVVGRTEAVSFCCAGSAGSRRLRVVRVMVAGPPAPTPRKAVAGGNLQGPHMQLDPHCCLPQEQGVARRVSEARWLLAWEAAMRRLMSSSRTALMSPPYLLVNCPSGMSRTCADNQDAMSMMYLPGLVLSMQCMARQPAVALQGVHHLSRQLHQLHCKLVHERPALVLCLIQQRLRPLLDCGHSSSTVQCAC